MTKLAQGAGDLHSGRSQVDFERLAATAAAVGVDPAPILAANTAMEAFSHGGEALAETIAQDAQTEALRMIEGAQIAVETMLVNRDGKIMGRADFK